MKPKDIKLEYLREELNESELASTAYLQFDNWFKEVVVHEITYANAMTLSTISAENKPKSRVVLMKDYDKNGIIFFSDYTSSKAIDLQFNKNVSLSFFWKELDRQIRINGKAIKIDEEENQKYWATRPRESQISALASNQSSIISRDELYTRVENLQKMFKDKPIPCPENWGGYKVEFELVEFWQGRPNRLHDRFLYEKKKEEWIITRLSP